MELWRFRRFVSRLDVRQGSPVITSRDKELPKCYVDRSCRCFLPWNSLEKKFSSFPGSIDLQQQVCY